MNIVVPTRPEKKEIYNYGQILFKIYLFSDINQTKENIEAQEI